MRTFRVLEARFLRAVADFENLGASDLPAIAFFGRSNVGKSSLLNALCGRKGLARTSRTPGCTNTVNYYEVRLGLEEQGDRASERIGETKVNFVDFPGFGFARASKAVKRNWGELVGRILLEREEIVCVALLVDCRRSPGEEEREIARLGREGGLVAAATKVDKLKRSLWKNRRKEIAGELGLSPEDVVLTSVSSSPKSGVDELLNRLCRSLG